MARTFFSPKRNLTVTMHDDATDEEIRQELKRKADERDADMRTAASARKAVRAENPLEEFLGPVTPEGGAAAERQEQEAAFRQKLAQFYGPEQAAKGVLRGEDPLEALSAGAFPATGFEEYHARDPLAGAITRHAPGVLAGMAASAAAGPQAGLMTRAAVQSGVTALTEALAGGISGEDPLEAGGKGLLYGLLGEVGGTAAGRVVPKIMAPFRSKLIPEAVKAQEVLAPLGGRLTPAQMVKSKTVGLLQTAAEYGIVSGGRMKKAGEASHDAAQTLLRSYIDDLPERGGQVISNMYTDLAKVSRGATADMAGAISVADDLVKTHRGRIPQIDEVAKWVQNLQKDYPDGVVPFSVAGQLRSDLLAVERRTFGTLAPQKVHGAAEKLAGTVDRAMERGAKAVGEDVYTAWRGTNAMARKAIFHSAVEDMVVAASKEGQISGKMLAGKLERLSHAARGKLDPGELSNLQEFANVLRIAEKRNPNETARMWIQFAQAGAAAGLVGYGAMEPTTAGAAITAPLLISLALTNPKTARWMTTGFGKVGTKEGTEIIGRVIGQVIGRKLAPPEKKGYTPTWEMAITP